MVFLFKLKKKCYLNLVVKLVPCTTHPNSWQYPLINYLDFKQVSLHLRLPLLRADAKYNLNGTLVNMFPLIGNGDMYIELRNFNIKILGELLIDSNDFARITNLRLDAKFESTDLYLENLLVIERGLGESINKIIPKVSWDFKVELKMFIYDLTKFWKKYDFGFLKLLLIYIWSNRWCTASNS